MTLAQWNKKYGALTPMNTDGTEWLVDLKRIKVSGASDELYHLDDFKPVYRILADEWFMIPKAADERAR